MNMLQAQTQTQIQHICNVSIPTPSSNASQTNGVNQWNEQCVNGNWTVVSDDVDFIPTANTAIKEIKLYVHIIHKEGDRSFNFTPQHEANLRNILETKVNQQLSNNVPYTLNGVNVPIPNIQDTRLRVKLVKFEYYENTALFNTYPWDLPYSLNSSWVTNYLPNLPKDGINVLFLDQDVDGSIFGGYGYYNGENIVVLKNVYKHFSLIHNMVFTNSFSSRIAGLLIHEVGHCIGLFHTWESKLYVPDLVLSNTSNDCAFLGATSTFMAGDGCTNNYMSYNHDNRKNFTPMQLGRIHQILLGNSKSTCLLGREYDATQPIKFVNNTEVWTTGTIIPNDIHVRHGGKLVIKCKVLMPERGQIIVEPGGTLIVDGGYITSANCEGRNQWAGIRAYGNGSGTQDIISIIPSVGFVQIINNSKIENASTGVLAYGGGVVQASNSEFINCARSIFLSNNDNGVNDLSVFRDNVFQINNDFKDFNFEAFIKLYKVRGIQIVGNKFNTSIEYSKFLTQLSPNESYGIFSLDANFIVDKGASNSEFKNLQIAIRASNFNTIHTFEVKNSHFRGVKDAITAYKVDFFKVSNNDIELLDVYGYTRGVQSVYGTGYDISRNKIQAKNYQVTPAKFPIGIEVLYGGYMDNVIKSNELSYLRFGNRAYGINGVNPFSAVNTTLGSARTGLAYFCNKNVANAGHDFYVNDIRENQGGLTLPAGNTFTHYSRGLFSDFFFSPLDGARPLGYVKYFYRNLPGGIETPFYYFRISPKPIGELYNLNCEGAMLDGDEGGLELAYSGIKSRINTNRQIFLTNNDRRIKELIRMIELVRSGAEAIGLSSTLTTSTEYFTKDIALGMLHNPYFTTTQIVNFLMYHQYLLMDTEILEGILHRDDITEAQRDAIIHREDNPLMDLKYRQIVELEALNFEKNILFNQLAHAYLMNLKPLNIAKLKNLFLEQNTPECDMALAYLESQDRTPIIGKNLIGDKYYLWNDEARTTYTGAAMTNSNLMDFVISHTGFDLLPSTDVTRVKAIADEDENAIALRAKNLINFFYGGKYKYDIDPTLEIENRDIGQSESLVKRDKMNSKGNIILFPNPLKAGEKLYVQGANIVNFTCFDVQGRRIENMRITKNINGIDLETVDLKSGMYLLRVITQEGDTESHRFIIY
jgi:hypothetical protein